MNCDTAFDLMTDAEGAASLALANHLAGCPRCRQMQETLAPALVFLSPQEPIQSVEDVASVFAAARAFRRDRRNRWSRPKPGESPTKRRLD